MQVQCFLQQSRRAVHCPGHSALLNPRLLVLLLPQVRTDEVEGFLLDRGFQIFLTSYPEAQVGP